jgi:hypothetical protein
VNHLHLRKITGGKDYKTDTYNPKNTRIDGLSYMVGRVAAKGEGMLGHHIAEVGDSIPRTLFIADEASGVDDMSYERATTWARRVLVIGNAYTCSNFFQKAIKGGDIVAKE